MNNIMLQEAAELRAAGQRILAIADEMEGGSNSVSTMPEVQQDFRNLATVASRLYALRRMRKDFISDELLGEPSWDILLDLFIMASFDRAVSVTSSCIASGVPATTALRYISMLEKEGLILRSPSLEDKRTCFLRLTTEGRDKIARLLAALNLTDRNRLPSGDAQERCFLLNNK